MKSIGILGGMGPRATVAFEKMLIDKFVGSDQNLPRIITINDGSIPDRSSYLLGKGVDPVPKMQRIIDDLDAVGCDVIAIPCNTACTPEIYRRLNASPAKLINLIELVVDHIAKHRFSKVLLLATEGTINSHKYQNLIGLNGIDCLSPSKQLTREVQKLINLIKQGYQLEAFNLSRQLSEQINQLEVEAVILGCTELPLVSRYLVPETVTPIDTLAILVNFCVDYIKEGELSWNRTNILSLRP